MVTAWNTIAEQLKIELEEVQRKWKGLMSTYRKECLKIARDPLREPKWFCFQALHCFLQRKSNILEREKLLGKKQQPKRRKLEGKAEDVAEQASEDDDFDWPQSEDDRDGGGEDEAEHISFVNPDDPSTFEEGTENQHKRKRISLSRLADTSNAPRSRERDECDAYGKYIAEVLMKMSKRTRAEVKKEISHTIFMAETGSFDELK